MNVAIALGAGLLSFLSPCVLPLVPAFLADLTGVASRAGTGRARAFLHALAFVLGFTAVFTMLWLAVAAFGSVAGEARYWIERAGGVFLIVLGLNMLGVVTIPFLAATRQARVTAGGESMTRSFLIGVTFGAGWTPCVGPYLATILTVLLNTSDLASGGLLLFAYALGLGVPFLVAALALDRVRGALRWLQRRGRVIEIAGGTLVIVMGVLLLSGRLTEIASRFSFQIG